jgi:hypothetical protein
MKMVKSLLLGTAAGFVAIAGAQAADLPVKAKPVQYVKICSLYGAGFYYIPGTDMCLKIGGWTRVYAAYGVNGNSTNGALATSNVNTRATQDFAPKVRGYITLDARNQTEYGTVRSYMAIGYSSGGPNNAIGSGNLGTALGTSTSNGAYDPGVGFSANRAFIQLAGFTFGVTQSFYDLYSQPATSFFGGMINPASDTGDAGKFALAYTAQFGGGLSASLSGEVARATPVVNAGAGSIFGASGSEAIPNTNSAVGTKWPDLVAALRVDQAWGSAQIMGAIHNASGQYYGSSDTSGEPANVIGWAVGAGIKLNAPMIGQGDYLQAQVNYSEGASGYVNASFANTYSQYTGGTFGFGFITDGVYSNGTGGDGTVQLTTAWGINAAYEHFWSPKWQTSVYGAYQAFSYDGQANALFCLQETGSLTTPGCSNNFSVWNVGTRTQFNVDSQTYLGLDVVYQYLNTALNGFPYGTGLGAETASTRMVTNQSAWMAEFRVHRNFYP